MEVKRIYENDHLVSRLKEGDKDAFDKLFAIFGKKLYYFSLKYVNVKEEAEEIVQEVFLKIWEHRDRLDEHLSFNAYVIKIAKNLIFNKAQKKVNEHAYLEYYTAHTTNINTDTESHIIYADLEAHANQEIERLPPKRKQIFLLSRKIGLSNQEISKQLNISKSTVENQINKALKSLKEYLYLQDIYPYLLLFCAVDL